MTDRLKGCVVVFSEDIREDDARPILLAIEQLKGVASVHAALLRLAGEADLSAMLEENAALLAELDRLREIRSSPVLEALKGCVHTSGEWGDPALGELGEKLIRLLEDP